MKRALVTLALVAVCTINVCADTSDSSEEPHRIVSDYATLCERCRTNKLPLCPTTKASPFNTTINCKEYSDQTCTIGIAATLDLAVDDNDTEHLCLFAQGVSAQDEEAWPPSAASPTQDEDTWPPSAPSPNHAPVEEVMPSVEAATETLTTEALDEMPPVPLPSIPPVPQVPPMDSLEGYQSDAAEGVAVAVSPKTTEAEDDEDDDDVLTTMKSPEEAKPPTELPPKPEARTTTTTQASVLKCYVCSSNDDASCAMLPTKEVNCASVKETGMGCFTLVKGSVTTRGCISDLTQESQSYCAFNKELCMLCFESSCNRDKAGGTSGASSRVYLAGERFLLAAVAGVLLCSLLRSE